ncbi:polysaccharide pyruvyl transferase family protein [Gordonia sp. ABSL1-1]|uniref:polysaccharide pyruvyl transferase family protein n=1 Tax=Gordonia sp. ABSL1-1 TaxID=3053923 RepID=UPI0025746609|nr:polysaccharide pyruvyl transferase family protein [Gordonia sp. ABSL1-1]MDL9937235.1 polysaccharide pyruvyl transferase family protein [Gordonia sp. ABSL1-1]
MHLPSEAARAARYARRVAVGSPIGKSLGLDEVIYLVAPSGYPNYGDELIARTWLRHLARHRPRATVVLDCHSPGQASLLLRNVHPRTVFVNTLWQLTEHAGNAPVPAADEQPDPRQPWRWVARAATDPGLAPRLSEGIDILNRASTIHLLGGGYLNTVWPHHVALVAAVAAVSGKTGARAVATGQGLIPHLEEPAWSVLRSAAGDFSVFDVRDSASADALGDIASAVHSGDDAWLALHRPPRNLFNRSGLRADGVILCLQSDLTDKFHGPDGSGVDALAGLVRRTLDSWRVPATRITVIEGIPGHDNAVAHRLGDRLDGARRIPFRDVWRHGLPAGSGSTWISTRFHPHLMAAAVGDPGVAIVPMPVYYSTKHQSLVDAGSHWTIVDDGFVVPDRPTARGFTAPDRDNAIAAKLALAQRVYPPTGIRRRRP